MKQIIYKIVEKGLLGIYIGIDKNGLSITIGPRGATIINEDDVTYLYINDPKSGFSNRIINITEQLISLKNKMVENIPTKNEGIDSSQDFITNEGLEGLQEHLEDVIKRRTEVSIKLKEKKFILACRQDDLVERQNKVKLKLLTKSETVEGLLNEIDEISAEILELTSEFYKAKAKINISAKKILADQYIKVAHQFYRLKDSHRIWNITSATNNNGIKSILVNSVTRKEVMFFLKDIDFIETNEPAFCLKYANKKHFYIYPPFFIIENQKYRVFDLRDLTFQFREQRFHEKDEHVLSHAKIIGYDWAKLNTDGSPNMRNKNIYQIPVVLYGILTFSFGKTFNETFCISDFDVAQNFSKEFLKYLALLNKNSSNNGRFINKPSIKSISDFE